MKLGTMIELGSWVLDTCTMKQSMPSKHQHKPAHLHDHLHLHLTSTSTSDICMWPALQCWLLRHSCGTQGRWPASSRRAAAATQRSARRSHAAGSSPRTRIVDTGGEGEHDQRHSPRANYLSIYLGNLPRLGGICCTGTPWILTARRAGRVPPSSSMPHWSPRRSKPNSRRAGTCTQSSGPGRPFSGVVFSGTALSRSPSPPSCPSPHAGAPPHRRAHDVC